MRVATVLLCAAALTACGSPGAVAENGESGAALPDPLSKSPASPTGGPPARNAAGNQTAGGAAAAIPPALQGRWGLSPSDCSSAAGQARGLLVVEPDEVRFYESRAVPAAGVQTSANSISGEFEFSGEGQQWTKHETLELRGDRLVRTERDPIGTFNYVRCE